MLDGMSDSIQGSRIENLQSREVDRQSPTGLILNLRDGHVTTFWHPSGAYICPCICQMPGHRLCRLARGTPSESRLSIGTIGLGQNCFLQAMRRTVEGYPKNAKNSVLGSGSAHATKFRIFFHDSTHPDLHCDGLPRKSRRWVVSIQDLGCLTSISKTQSFWFGLEPPTRRSRSELAHKCIQYNNRCMQNFIQIG